MSDGEERARDKDAYPIRIFEQAGALGRALADLLAERMEAPAPVNQPFAVMLAGGHTPLDAYRQLADRPVTPSQGLYVLLSDERLVPPESADSNFSRLAPMLSTLGMPQHRLLLVRTELDAEAAADEYDREIAHFFEQGGRLPLGILGLGSDGHTASLFSADDLARGQGRNAVAVQRPDGRVGISVTPAVFARVQRLLFIVTGQDKQPIVRQFFGNPLSTVAGRAVAKHTGVECWVDAAAAP